MTAEKKVLTYSVELKRQNDFNETSSCPETQLKNKLWLIFDHIILYIDIIWYTDQLINSITFPCFSSGIFINILDIIYLFFSFKEGNWDLGWNYDSSWGPTSRCPFRDKYVALAPSWKTFYGAPSICGHWGGVSKGKFSTTCHLQKLPLSVQLKLGFYLKFPWISSI